MFFVFIEGLFYMIQRKCVTESRLKVSFPSGVGVLIDTEQTVVASFGEKALLNCQLTQSKDVLQVTWQKLLPKGEDNVATCNKYFGQRVNAGFQGKVAFEAAGLQNSSIVIRNVVEQDEGCYLCIFNTYLEGAFTATTCLKLYGKKIYIYLLCVSIVHFEAS